MVVDIVAGIVGMGVAEMMRFGFVGSGPPWPSAKLQGHELFLLLSLLEWSR